MIKKLLLLLFGTASLLVSSKAQINMDCVDMISNDYNTIKKLVNDYETNATQEVILEDILELSKDLINTYEECTSKCIF